MSTRRHVSRRVKPVRGLQTPIQVVRHSQWNQLSVAPVRTPRYVTQSDVRFASMPESRDSVDVMTSLDTLYDRVS